MEICKINCVDIFEGLLVRRALVRKVFDSFSNKHEKAAQRRFKMCDSSDMDYSDDDLDPMDYYGGKFRRRDGRRLSLVRC